MTDETIPPEFSTKPVETDRIKKDKSDPHGIMVRLHQNDWDLLKVMLKRDGLSFQKFISLVSKGYLEADPNIIKCLRTYRSLELVPQDQVARGVFSNRERQQIYAELEAAEKESK